jgi:MoaA/NifB/PqqE/SkfB family radical SAM enzyme
LGKTHLVYLQGWGEPFLHPQFFEMLQTVKEEGCMVGTTTNGTLLDRGLIEGLVDKGLDIIGFSRAGGDQKNDRIRKGTSIKNVLECMAEIRKVKDKYRVDYPEIQIACMLLRTGLDDLEKLPQFLADTGATQTVLRSAKFIFRQYSSGILRDRQAAPGAVQHRIRQQSNLFNGHPIFRSHTH